jgi:hypothetical protein
LLWEIHARNGFSSMQVRRLPGGMFAPIRMAE